MPADRLALDKEGVDAVLLPGEERKKTGLNAFGRQLECIAALVMLDMGKFGGGRAKNDYSLYRTRDVIVMEDYYYVMSGGWDSCSDWDSCDSTQRSGSRLKTLQP